MLPLKRKRVEKENIMEIDGAEGSSSENEWVDQDLDGDSSEQDSDVGFIQNAISKRNVKEGTEILKKTSKVKGKGKAKGEVGGGSFQSMGLHPSLLRALTLRGFKTPTPIQRVSIPLLLSSPPRDLVGMARTGSGKTLAYMIPLLQRLGGRHSPIVGARALILVPSRELAVQVLKVGRDLARGWKDGGDHAGEKDDANAISASSSALRWALVVGGEGLDEQFETMANNPDVIIATPGRLLHLKIEMSLSLSSIQYLVFDEADRLFELGFATHLTTILEALPTTRQTLLFSATLPKSLVDFAKAGLREPKLVRLDSEMKISGDLRMSFWWVKAGEKTAGLLSLLRDVIGVPLKIDLPHPSGSSDKAKSKKGEGSGAAVLAPHQTLIFVSTQHHVHYLSTLLDQVGYAVSAIHGNLTQSARTFAMSQFSTNQTSVMVTTDVAARGIDIPILENVVNYDFPVGNRIFVHRVGRTARMGRRGWAWNLVTRDELPYLLDLQLFLSRPLISNQSPSSTSPTESQFTDALILGPFPRDILDQEMEYIRNLEDKNYELVTLRGVMERGSQMYGRTKGKASPVSYTRAKEFEKGWNREGRENANPAWVLRVGRPQTNQDRGTERSQKGDSMSNGDAKIKSREDLLKTLAGFKPSETVFEVGSRGKTAGAQLMKERRRALSKANSRTTIPLVDKDDDESSADEQADREDVEMADEDDIVNTFGPGRGSKSKAPRPATYKDEEFYMSHYQKDAETEKGYSLRDGASFAEQASHVTFDLTTDNGGPSASRRQSQLKWDRKKKKFVKGDGVGADNVKMIKTEGGTKVPISYKSGRYNEWIKGRGRGRELRVGETETNQRRGAGGKKWRHNKLAEGKPLDKLATDYDRKMRIMGKKASGNPDQEEGGKPQGKGVAGKGKAMNANGRWKGKTASRVKNELKSVQQIRKQRSLLEKRKEKNARGSKKGKGRGRH